MSNLVKIKITEVVQTVRTRIVDIEVVNYSHILDCKGKTLDLDDGDENTEQILQAITAYVRNQHSTEGDMTEEVIKATIY